MKNKQNLQDLQVGISIAAGIFMIALAIMQVFFPMLKMDIRMFCGIELCLFVITILPLINNKK